MNKQIKRAAATAAAATVILLTTTLPAHAADTDTAGGLSFLREAAEAIITFVKQVLA
ncbi:hypothetical protein ACFXD5_41185 [Streptomyces sp. NPDC059385]|uniref:hypothetical protein n=1 Tax=Streptomyces sp. NPDC059385 TaxID=3346817 RepID=UPI0036CA1D1A